MKYQDIICRMSLEEKAAMLSGKDHWQTRDFLKYGIPSIFCADGPHGVRKQIGEADHLGLNKSLPATCFPTAATISNSWDPSLGEQIGSAMGLEASVQDVHVLLGPGLNIKRSPLCGRNFEYFSEDPYLSGKMAAGYVRGIQSEGVAACPKHYAVNSQETRRMASDSILDERTLREIYLTAFEIMVKESKPKSIMSSYNQVNGSYANENSFLLQDILREEWGFNGSVITDWGGSNSHTEGVRSGSNLEMPSPGGDSIRELVAAVNEGNLDESIIDERIDELLELIFSTTERNQKKANTFDEQTHHALAKKAAVESIVLLKNENHVLPLSEDKKVVVIGDFAKTPRYQGAGSSMVNPSKLDSIQELISEYNLDYVGYAQGFKRNKKADEQLMREALDLARQSDVVVLCLGLDEVSECEGMDRMHMQIPQNQIELLNELTAVDKQIVVLLSAGASIEMPWTDQCTAILHGYLGGQAGAGAMLDIITGKAYPSGRLSETYPLVYEDTPAYKYFPGKKRTVEYRESLFVGYRYYNTAQIPVKYPFGFGLSYTTFEYGELTVDGTNITFQLTNTGIRNGAEVPQVYIGCKSDNVFRPKRELKGFAKVFLEAGETRKITIELDDKAFRFYNIQTKKWEIEDATYEIMVGSNVEDIKLAQEVDVKGTTVGEIYDHEKMACYYSADVQNVSDEAFEQLLGHPVPTGGWQGMLDHNDAMCQMVYAKGIFARLVYKVMTRLKNKSIKRAKPDMDILFIYNMPFRGIAKMTEGLVSMNMVEGMLMVVNGKFFKGLRKIVGGYFRNKKENKILEHRLTQGSTIDK